MLSGLSGSVAKADNGAGSVLRVQCDMCRVAVQLLPRSPSFLYDVRLHPMAVLPEVHVSLPERHPECERVSIREVCLSAHLNHRSSTVLSLQQHCALTALAADSLAQAT